MEEVKSKKPRQYKYAGRVMWNTALPLAANKRENNYVQNIKRVEMFDSLGFYRYLDGDVVKQEQRGGRGVKSITLKMIESLLSKITVDNYKVVIKNLFKKNYMSARGARLALKNCSTVLGQPLTENEITLMIKSWV